MSPAYYGVDIEARYPNGSSFRALHLNPYSQTPLASRDADRLTTELQGRAATITPRFTVTAASTPFNFDDSENYNDPYGTDASVLLATALPGTRA